MKSYFSTLNRARLEQANFCHFYALMLIAQYVQELDQTPKELVLVRFLQTAKQQFLDSSPHEILEAEQYFVELLRQGKEFAAQQIKGEEIPIGLTTRSGSFEIESHQDPTEGLSQVLALAGNCLLGLSSGAAFTSVLTGFGPEGVLQVGALIAVHYPSLSKEPDKLEAVRNLIEQLKQCPTESISN